MYNERRFIDEGQETLVELTNRTVQGRFLLRPSRELNEIVHGALARAQRKYGVAVHGFVFLSDHYHLLASVRSAKQMSDFVGYFQSKIAKEVCRLHDWQDKVWARRFRHIVVLDEDAQHERLAYLLANGCKEGLVASPLDWPGAHFAKAIAAGEFSVDGSWLDRTGLWEARRRSGRIDREDFVEPETLQLTPVPACASMTREEYVAHLSRLTQEVENRAAQAHRDAGTRPMGAKRVLRCHPHQRARSLDRRPAPLVHASTRAARLAFRAAYRAFVAACAQATERLRATGDTSTFPPGAFIPSLPRQAVAIDTS